MSLAFLLRRLRQRRRPEAVIDRAYPAWLRRAGAPDPAAWHRAIAALRSPPDFTVIMPVHDPEPAWLAEAIASVRDQLYPHWQLCVADDASQAPGIAEILAGAAGPRIDIVRLTARKGISGASNAALARATGGFVTFLDHDDRLAPHALAAMACAIAAHPEAALLFSDEDQLIDGRRARPYFKPGWNPDLVMAQNLVCHMAVYRRDLAERLGGLRPAFDGSQDFDFSLRATASLGPQEVHHVPLVLYHWRQSPHSVSAAAAAACQDAGRRALAEATGLPVSPAPGVPQWSRVEIPLPAAPKLVSVISGQPGALTTPGPYDPVEAVPLAMAKGEVLLLLTGGLEPMDERWLHELVALACTPGVGAVGARLTLRDGRIVQAGYTLDPRHVVRRLAVRADSDDVGYRGQYRLRRTVAAVSGDCLAVRRDHFGAVGGLDHGMGAYMAIDLCLRLAERGLRTVWTPYAWLAYAHVPRALHDRAGCAAMLARWGHVLARDPLANPNLRWGRGRVFLAAPAWQETIA